MRRSHLILWGPGHIFIYKGPQLLIQPLRVLRVRAWTTSPVLPDRGTGSQDQIVPNHGLHFDLGGFWPVVVLLSACVQPC
jgi:hypothetical protein